jgi:hypothetical protein
MCMIMTHGLIRSCLVSRWSSEIERGFGLMAVDLMALVKK